MKHDWEYKKLGEVAEIIGGSTPKTNIKEYWDGDYFWITPAELKGDRFIKSTSRTITDLAVENTNLSLLPKGTVLLSSRAPIGKVAIADVPMYCNQGFKNIICGEKLNNNYVYWLLYGKTEYLNSLGVGATFKEISKKIVENIPIPLPPLSTQQSIVSELDSLSQIIADCKETLKDYDALEQSIFYDMFGDPVKNDKGWEVKKLGEVCEITSSKRIFAEEYVQTGIPFYRSKEVIEKSKGLPISVELYISKDKYQLIKNEYGIPSIGDILITAVGTIGKIWVVDSDDEFYFKDGNLIWLKNFINDINSTYFRYSLTLLIDNYKKTYANGAAYAALTIINLKKMQCFLPPLSLQQEFASRITTIEELKSETKKALQEAETLFQARMDYWFN